MRYFRGSNRHVPTIRVQSVPSGLSPRDWVATVLVASRQWKRWEKLQDEFFLMCWRLL